MVKWKPAGVITQPELFFCCCPANRADKRVSRYKTLDEQRAERRSYFSEKEIAIDAPTAPPRQKR